MYIAYYRVSTTAQGISGLGLEAQKASVKSFLKGEEPIAEFQEVESGKVKERPELQKAMDLARREKATLVIAKLDRLARNAAFVLGLRDSGVEFVAADMPQANRMTIGIIACIAEGEAEMISQRTRSALAAAKARGVKLGNPRAGEALLKARAKRSELAAAFRARLAPVVQELREANVRSLRGIARCLNVRGIRTIQGRSFCARTVKELA